MPYLEIHLGSESLLVPFSGRIDYVIGRLPKADIQLRDMKVSRLHTQLFIDSRNKPFVRDLGSSGGTQLNGMRLESGAVAALTTGARVRIGEARITYFGNEPPVKIPPPPSTSTPRGMIRANTRVRQAYPPPAAKPAAPGDTGPAEPAPEVIAADFADGSDGQPAAQPAPTLKPASGANPPKKRKETGIVTAPWEDSESSRMKPAGQEKRVTLSPATRAAPGSQPMPSAEIDETGKFHDPSAPPPRTGRPISPLPPRIPGSPVPHGPATRNPDHEIGESAAAFVPPPPPSSSAVTRGDSHGGIPTVRLDRAAIAARQASEEVPVAPKIPTAEVKPGTHKPIEDHAPAPRIGLEAHERPKPIEDFAGDLQEEDVAGPQAISSGKMPAYLGGQDADYGAVNFGEGAKEEESSDDVAFSSRAKAVPDDSIDFEIDTAAAAAAGVAKPQKTRRLKKRRTDKLVPEPVADGDPTEEMAAPGDANFEAQQVAGGAKTVFIPKPEGAEFERRPAAASDAEKAAQLERLARGPGGDTLAIPPPLLSGMRAGLDKPPTGGPAVVIDEGDSISESSAMLTPPPIDQTRPRKHRTKIIKAQDFAADDAAPPDKNSLPGAGSGETQVD